MSCRVASWCQWTMPAAYPKSKDGWITKFMPKSCFFVKISLQKHFVSTRNSKKFVLGWITSLSTSWRKLSRPWSWTIFPSTSPPPPSCQLKKKFKPVFFFHEFAAIRCKIVHCFQKNVQNFKFFTKIIVVLGSVSRSSQVARWMCCGACWESFYPRIVLLLTWWRQDRSSQKEEGEERTDEQNEIGPAQGRSCLSGRDWPMPQVSSLAQHAPRVVREPLRHVHPDRFLYRHRRPQRQDPKRLQRLLLVEEKKLTSKFENFVKKMFR